MTGARARRRRRRLFTAGLFTAARSRAQAVHPPLLLLSAAAASASPVNCTRSSMRSPARSRAALLREELAHCHEALVSTLRAWDDDGEGTCNRRDFRRAIQAVGVFSQPPSREEIDVLFSQLIEASPTGGEALRYADLAVALPESPQILANGRTLSPPVVRAANACFGAAAAAAGGATPTGNGTWLEDLPAFSQNVFRSAPYLGLGKVAASPAPAAAGEADAVRAELLPGLLSRQQMLAAEQLHEAVALAQPERGAATSHSALTTTAATTATALPAWLLELLQLHQRDVGALFRGWEGEGRLTVPLGAFADGVKAKTDVELSEAECRHVLSCLEPSRADEVAASTAWRALQFDYRQLARALLVDHQRTASQYIRRNSVRGERRP